MRTSYSEIGTESPGRQPHEILRDLDLALDQARRLLHIAVCTNQAAAASRLTAAADAAAKFQLAVCLFAKPGNGAPRLARWLEESMPAPCRLHATVCETTSYRDLPPDMLAGARHAAAAVFVIPASAPLFDETLDFLAHAFAAACQSVILAVASEDPAGNDAALIAEIAGTVSGDARLRNIAVCGAEDLIAVLTESCLRDAAQSTLAGLRALAPAAARELLPVAAAFAEFLTLPQPRYLRRISYIQRDIEALGAIGRQAYACFNREIENVLSQADAAIRGLVPAARQQAEAVIPQGPIPKEAAMDPGARTRFAQQTAAAARAAARREFDARIQALAMRLNSARSLLLTSMEQFRAAALPHLEELVSNLGSGLFLSWMHAAGHDWAGHPFDLALDPGVDFPDRITAAAARICNAIPGQEFVAGWQSRLDSMLRSEITAAATAGWTVFAIDQPLIEAVHGIWFETAQKLCGLLVGRLETLVRVAGAGLASTRIGCLQLPRDPALRKRLADLYRGFLVELESIRRQAVFSEDPA